jgi:lipopolysaccharide biosynthesis glycosyltransferase
MIIALCVDDNYFEQACAVIRSLEYHHKNEKIKVYLVGFGLGDKSIAKLNKMETGYLSVQHVASDVMEFEEFAISGHISRASYVKLALSRLLVNESKVLYLDADLIVTSTLHKVWNTNLVGKALAGVVNPFFNRNDDIFMDKDSKYFNAGVMLFNFEYFRKFEIAEKAYSFMKNHKERAIFHGNWVELHIVCNFQTFFLRKFHCFSKEMKTEILTAVKSPVIVHFSSGMKPWEQFDPHPFRKKFLKYYRGEILKTNSSKEFCRNFLRFLYVKLYYFWHLKINKLRQVR